MHNLKQCIYEVLSPKFTSMNKINQSVSPTWLPSHASISEVNGCCLLLPSRQQCHVLERGTSSTLLPSRA